MKILSTLIVCVFAAAGCGGGKKTETTTTTTTTTTGSGDAAGSATGDGQPCTQEIAMVCPEDQIDGCLKTPAEGTVHACVAK